MRSNDSFKSVVPARMNKAYCFWMLSECGGIPSLQPTAAEGKPHGNPDPYAVQPFHGPPQLRRPGHCGLEAERLRHTGQEPVAVRLLLGIQHSEQWKHALFFVQISSSSLLSSWQNNDKRQLYCVFMALHIVGAAPGANAYRCVH